MVPARSPASTRCPAILTTLLLATLPPGALSAQGAPPRDTVVLRARGPVHPGIATLTEELRIGVVEGDEVYMFGEIADLAVGPGGDIFVYDRSLPAVRVYGADGRFQRTVGRRGQGPGEFGSVSGIAVDRTGRLLAWDTGNWRINVFSPTGEVLPQIATPGTGTATYSRALTLDTAGVLWCRVNLINRSTLTLTLAWLRYRPDGRLLDTITPPPLARGAQVLSATTPRSRTSVELPFAPVPVSTVSPLGYLVTGYPDRLAFELHPPGRAVQSIRREVAPVAVGRQERDSARDDVTARLRRTDPAWTWSGPDIPRTRPHYATLMVGEDGRIWVPVVPEVTPRVGSISGPGMAGSGPGRPSPRQGPPPPRPQPRPARHEVYQPDGTYLGQVEIPAGVATVVRRGDLIWAVGYDEDDVASVRRYRIRWR